MKFYNNYSLKISYLLSLTAKIFPLCVFDVIYLFSIQVDYIPYSDELAELIGCKPSLWRLLIQDPVLALRCFFGPCTPPQYRLVGPGAWSGAKKAIEEVHNNVIYATKTRVIEQKEKDGWSFGVKILIFFIVVLSLLVKWFL